MNEYIPISHLQVGQKCDQTFLVHSYTKCWNRIEIEFIDVTGRITAVYWDSKIQHPEICQEGKYVNIQGFVKQYKDSRQINIRSVNAFNGTPLNITDYISGPNESVLDHYCSILNSYIDQMEDPHYRDFLNYAVGKLDVIHMLKNSAYGLEGPMANKGGLLLHTVHHLQSILSVVEKFGENNDLKINKSLLITGSIFRNLGWATTTFIKGSGTEPMDSFYTISPQMSAFRLIDHAMLGAESDLKIKIPESHKQALSNICNDKPTTLEGKLIAMSDQLAQILEVGHNLLMQNKNKNWIDRLFVGHLS